MHRKAILLTLVSALFLALTACGSPATAPWSAAEPLEGSVRGRSETAPPASADPGQPPQVVSGDPSIPPMPEDWMQVPNTALVYYGTSSYDVEADNVRVNVRSWLMAASPADYRDYESFSHAVDAWYAMQVDAQADFERIDEKTYFTWGDVEIRIEADIGVDDDFEVLFSISEREPID